jgi:predicted 2-oxoglutarate/Fe(II)-dependent dioxygenase YbiX/peroxiredoxin
MAMYVALGAGDPAPWFTQRSFANPSYAFHTSAGRYIVLCYFGSAADAHSQAAFKAVRELSDVFDDEFASFFGASCDPGDEAERRVADSYPGYRFFWDFDGTIGRAYGTLPKDEAPSAGSMMRSWFVLDPTHRLIGVFPFAEDQSDIGALIECMKRLPPPAEFAGFEVHAPILILPRVFDPDFCRELIALYERDGGEDSGYMRDQNGKTVMVTDHAHKRRRDFHVSDPALITKVKLFVLRRIAPEILKVHQYKITRMERYIVGCYSSEDGGHFAPHRDNTTAATAHRRFAVSINLNDDFEGGEVGFPEYGPRRYKAPAGGAVVFSCSLLHSVSQVSRGRRYAFLPFLYDEAAAAIREANNKFLGEGVQQYDPAAQS